MNTNETRYLIRVLLLTFRKVAALVATLVLVACGGGGSTGTGGAAGGPAATSLRTLPPRCLTSDVHQITVPWYYDRGDSPTFTYRYQLRPGSSPTAPYVIVLHGGPGVPAIGTDEGRVPAAYNVIYTDLRGSGCNMKPEMDSYYPLDFYSTTYAAQDVMRVIQALGLTNYYIFGQSYGTVHATTLAYLIEQSSLAWPRLVVLEGIVGKYLSSYDEYFAGYDVQWQRIKPQIDPAVLTALTSNTNYLGYTSQQWALFLVISLSTFAGTVPGTSLDLVATQLNPLADLTTPAGQAAKAYVDGFMNPPSSSSAATQENLARAVTNTGFSCQELFGTQTHADLVGGSIVGAGPDNCAAIPGLTPLMHAYDSANFKIATPLLYFHGDHDAATPLAGAKYHFNNQTLAPKVFVTVLGTSHDPIEYQFYTKGCTTAIWNSIIMAPANFMAALNSCGWPYTIE